MQIRGAIVPPQAMQRFQAVHEHIRPENQRRKLSDRHTAYLPKDML